MDAFVWKVDFWHWWILAAILLVFEAIIPGFFFLWMAVAGAAIGLILWVFPALGWQYQVLLFALTSIISIIIFRRYQRIHPIQSDQPALNRRGEQYLGRVFTLDTPIVNGVGKLHVDDTTWRISGDDLASGTKVKVTGVEGVTLQVSPFTH
jgi:membrane protein implicated in regulation of membrane protease activity